MTDLAVLQSVIGHILRDDHNAKVVPRVCAAVTSAVPCDGDALTIMKSVIQSELVFASDDVMAEFERAQLTVGEGPSLQAFGWSRPVLVPDMTHSSVPLRWPMLLGDAASAPLGSVFCFPMRVGAIRLGVFTLYRRVPRSLDRAELTFVHGAIDMMTSALLDLRARATGQSPLGRWLTVDGLRHDRVAQATGMLIVQLGVNAEAALARLRAHAYAETRDIEQVAEDIVNRLLRLDADPV